jgi:hypothetical protein
MKNERLFFHGFCIAVFAGQLLLLTRGSGLPIPVFYAVSPLILTFEALETWTNCKPDFTICPTFHRSFRVSPDYLSAIPAWLSASEPKTL